MARKSAHIGLIVASFMAALGLTIMPLPDALIWLRPYWVALMLIYWCIEAPEKVDIGMAFVLGLVVDLLTGALLGQHALGLVVIAYIVSRFRLRIRFFPLWQQALGVLAILLNDRLIAIWIQALTGHARPDWQVALAPLVAMAIWPFLFVLMDRAQQQQRARTRH